MLVTSRVSLYREGFVQLLAPNARINVVASASSSDELLVKVSRHRPDVVLYDVTPPASPVEVRDLIAIAPEVKVVAVALNREDDFVAFAEAGAVGFVPREGVTEDLVAAIESGHRGETILSPRIGAALLRRLTVLSAQHKGRDDDVLARLTPRELEILEWIDRGYSNREIASRLCIELPTVKNHVHNILEKLNVKRRAEATACVRSRRREAVEFAELSQNGNGASPGSARR